MGTFVLLSAILKHLQTDSGCPVARCWTWAQRSSYLPGGRAWAWLPRGLAQANRVPFMETPFEKTSVTPPFGASCGFPVVPNHPASHPAPRSCACHLAPPHPRDSPSRMLLHAQCPASPPLRLRPGSGGHGGSVLPLHLGHTAAASEGTGGESSLTFGKRAPLWGCAADRLLGCSLSKLRQGCHGHGHVVLPIGACPGPC